MSKTHASMTSVVLLLLLAIDVDAAAQSASAKRGRLQPFGGRLAGGPTKVIITITGLVSLADASPSSGGAVMPKKLYFLDPARTTSMPHLPIILAHQKYKPQSPIGRPVSSEGKYRYVKIENAEILDVLGVDKAANKLDYTEDPPAGDNLCPTNDESKSLYFVPRLSRISKKSDGSAVTFADLDPDYINPKPTKVAGMMDVSYGRLVSIVTMPVVWDFKKNAGSFGSTYRQMIAESIEWSFTIPSDTLTITTSDGTTTQALLTLSANGYPDIRLTLANAPDPEGIKFLAGTAQKRPQPPTDDHFVAYYDYIADPKIVRYIPVVAGVCIGNSGFETDPCIVAGYVNIGDPGNCGKAVTPVQVNGVNCGPDNLP
jgi:hypothetical protein